MQLFEVTGVPADFLIVQGIYQSRKILSNFISLLTIFKDINSHILCVFNEEVNNPKYNYSAGTPVISTTSRHEIDEIKLYTSIYYAVIRFYEPKNDNTIIQP